MNPAIKRIFDNIMHTRNEKVMEIFPIIGNGSVNQIFIVITDKEKLVIRLNQDRGFDEFIKEKWCIEKAAARGVVGPTVIAMGEMDGYSYMIQSFLEGTLGTQAGIDAVMVWKEIGTYAKLIHSISVSGFGLACSELMESNLHTSQKKWEKYVTYNIESLTENDKLLQLGALTAEQSQKVKNLFEELRKKTFVFGLNHGDLSLKNVMVSNQNKVRLFDWGSAEAQVVPYHDFGEVLKSSLESASPEFKAFLKGYGMPEEEYEKIADDIHAIMLLRAIDKLRWAIDKHPVDILAFTETVKKFITYI